MSLTHKYRMMQNAKKEMYAYKELNKDNTPRLRLRDPQPMCLRETTLDRRCLKYIRQSAEVKVICHPTPGNTHKLTDLPTTCQRTTNTYSATD